MVLCSLQNVLVCVQLVLEIRRCIHASRDKDNPCGMVYLDTIVLKEYMGPFNSKATTKLLSHTKRKKKLTLVLEFICREKKIKSGTDNTSSLELTLLAREGGRNSL